jgi:hypothetical protein
MARILGVGRSSASSLNNKEDNESDVALLSPKDPNRWENFKEGHG